MTNPFEELSAKLDRISDELSKLVDQVNTGSTKNQSKLIPESEMIKMLGISRTTSIDWRRRKLLPYKRIGSRIYYVESDVIKAMQRGTLQGKTAL